MDMITENNLEQLHTKQNYFKDSFYINTQKPIKLSQKIKGNLIKYAKPFSLGISSYLGFELIKKMSIKSYEVPSKFYHNTVNLFNNTIDSINLFFLNSYETINPKYYFYSIPEILSIISYMAGLYFMIQFTIKIKNSGHHREDNSISSTITFAVVALLLFTVPALINACGDAVWSGTPQGLLNKNI